MTRRTLLLPLLLTALCLLAGASVARAQDGDHRAGLIIRYADGSVQKQCVAFSEPSITGAELLTRSGLQVTMDSSGMGGAVCSIAGKGCAFPTQDCFCRCEGLTCEYWAYYHWTDGWQYSQVGAGGYAVTDGALEGWSWGAGNWSSGVEPPALTFAEVCPAPAAATPIATVTAMPTATAAPTTRALATPSPTPILLAYVQPDSSSGKRSDARAQSFGGNLATNVSAAPSRDFSPALLPGYAAYLLTLAGLASVGAWVVRRKSNALRKS
jgi:hypothetical protein